MVLDYSCVRYVSSSSSRSKGKVREADGRYVITKEQTSLQPLLLQKKQN